MVVRAIDQDATNAHVAHLAKGVCSVMGKASPGRTALGKPLYPCGWACGSVEMGVMPVTQKLLMIPTAPLSHHENAHAVLQSRSR
jgi:hypothetical protein